jgi:hypothetical protein
MTHTPAHKNKREAFKNFPKLFRTKRESDGKGRQAVLTGTGHTPLQTASGHLSAWLKQGRDWLML